MNSFDEIWISDEHRKILIQFLQGFTYQQIGDGKGVSKQRIEQIVKSYIPNKNRRSYNAKFYKRLCSELIQKYGTMSNFSKVVGFNYAHMYSRLHQGADFTFSEALKIYELLDTSIPISELFKKDE